MSIQLPRVDVRARFSFKGPVSDGNVKTREDAGKPILSFSAVLSAVSVAALCAGSALAGPQQKLVRPEPPANSSLNAPAATSAAATQIATPQTTTEPARGIPNVRVNSPQQAFPNGLLGRSETTVAASSDGRFLLAGFNDAQGFCGPPFGALCTPENPPGLSGFAFSTNGGLTWTDGGAPDPALSPAGNVFTRGDPWMDRGGFDGQTFYYSNLAVDITTGNSLGVSVHRGQFDEEEGFRFTDVHTFNAPHPGDLYDKDAMAAAKDGSGAAYVSISNFIEVCGIPAFGFGQIEVWRTHDAGEVWQGPAIVSPDQTFITDPKDPNCGLTGTEQQGSAPAIGPNGEVYVTWLAGPTFTGSGGSVVSTGATIQVARSLDGGVTFGPATTVATTNVSLGRTAPGGYNRASRLDSPRIAVDTTGSHQGRVYVTFTSEVGPAPIPGTVTCPSGLPKTAVCVGQDPLSEEAFISYSDDRGQTWSKPKRLATKVPHNGVKRMWPVPSVEPTGNVNVVYYESLEVSTASNPQCVIALDVANLFRVGPANSLVNTMWVQSRNGGKTFAAPVKVTDVTSNWCTTATDIFPNFGDYIGGTSAERRVLPIWADGRNGVPDTFFAPIVEAEERE
jgi:BNR/Asp-box repeat